jgi:bacteriocin biosynthesis cyclodehydratase domain-containing protein
VNDGLDEAHQYRLAKCDLIDVPGGAILKRGVVEFFVKGENVGVLLRPLLEAETSGDLDSIVFFLSTKFPKIASDQLKRLLLDLVRSHFLESIPSTEPRKKATPESPTSVFLWTHGISLQGQSDLLSQFNVSIVGLNNISVALSSAIRDLGFPKTTIIDVPDLRAEVSPTNRGLLASSSDFIEVVGSIPEQELVGSRILVVASEGSALQSFRHWHETGFLRNLPFLPVWLYDELGFIGPLVVPNISACFECFRARENSHLRSPDIFRAVSDRLPPNSSGIAYLPTMPDVLGKLAALQLTKHVLGYQVGSSVNRVIRLDFLSYSMTGSRILKAPRCKICSSYNARSAIDIDAVDANTIDWIMNE